MFLSTWFIQVDTFFNLETLLSCFTSLCKFRVTYLDTTADAGEGAPEVIFDWFPTTPLAVLTPYRNKISAWSSSYVCYIQHIFS